MCPQLNFSLAEYVPVTPVTSYTRKCDGKKGGVEKDKGLNRYVTFYILMYDHINPINPWSLRSYKGGLCK